MSHESDYIFFWNHVVSPSNPYSLAVFSQWYPLSFIDPDQADIEFKTSEHYMMYAKALLFDPSRAEDVLAAPTPPDAQKIGRELKGWDKKKWDAVADGVVERGNYLKFGQSRDGKALQTLLGTRGKEMIEASPKDRIWGIGYGTKEAWAHREDWGTNRSVEPPSHFREQYASRAECEREREMDKLMKWYIEWARRYSAPARH